MEFNFFCLTYFISSNFIKIPYRIYRKRWVLLKHLHVHIFASDLNSSYLNLSQKPTRNRTEKSGNSSATKEIAKSRNRVKGRKRAFVVITKATCIEPISDLKCLGIVLMNLLYFRIFYWISDTRGRRATAALYLALACIFELGKQGRSCH